MFWIIPTETDFIEKRCVRRLNAHYSAELLKVDAGPAGSVWGQTSCRREPKYFFLSKVQNKFPNGSVFLKYVHCYNVQWMYLDSKWFCQQKMSTVFIFNKCTFPFLVLDLLCSSSILFLILKHLASTLHISYFRYFTAQVNNAVGVEDRLQIQLSNT